MDAGAAYRALAEATPRSSRPGVGDCGPDVASLEARGWSDKRRRLRGKTPRLDVITTPYVLTWMRYIDGNVVSETSRQYISNLMNITAAPVAKVQTTLSAY